MKNEFERKFLMTQEEIVKLFDKKLPRVVYKMIQGYFWTDDKSKEFRIRMQAENTFDSKLKCFLTIKEIPKNIYDQTGDDREEAEFEIAKRDAFYHLRNSCKKFIEKKRYILDWKRYLTFEINVINERTNILEIEFNSKDEMDNYLPDFDYSMEVTNDRRFYSYNMATEYNKEELDLALQYFDEKRFK